MKLLLFAWLLGVPLLAQDMSVTGSIEVGARWIPTTDGSLATYRSVVDLGQGVRLFWHGRGHRIILRKCAGRLARQCQCFLIGLAAHIPD